MGLKLVPFHDGWVTNHKADLHAIYRRPRWVEDDYGELTRETDADGLPTWDLTGPLPVKSHNRWRQKGFEYVTLANRESLGQAWRLGMLPPGEKPSEYDQHAVGGPWNFRLYAKGAEATRTLEVEQLRADVAEFGSRAVEAIRRQTDPGFRLPPDLQGIGPRTMTVVASADDEPSEPALAIGVPVRKVAKREPAG